MNAELKDKLRKYSGLAGSVAVSSIATSQIVYTDINPDAYLHNHNDSMQLDLNNDLIMDYTFKQWDTIIRYTGTSYTSSFRAWAPLVTPLNSNSVVVDSSYSSSPKLFSSSQAFAQGPWSGGSSTSSYPMFFGYFIKSYSGTQTYTSSAGNWNNKGLRFIGLRVQAGSNTYYGWARVSVEKDYKSITIHDYAYNSVPGDTLLTGQKHPLSVEQLSKKEVGIDSDGSKLYLTGDLTEAKIKAYGTNGQLVLNTTFTGNAKREEFDLKDLETGIYVVQVTEGQHTWKEKIFVK